MRRGIKTFTALTLLALAVVAVSYGGSSAPKKLSPTAAAPSADRPALMKQHRGGTLKLVAKAAGGTIDPHVNYTLQYWQLYQATYDGLLGFEKAGGNAAFTVVPDLATAIPTPTNGGKTWTFKLRNGIKFSNGQPVTTNDVVASFRRIFKVKSPTSGGFYAGIVGADACLKTPATCTLKGGVSANAAARTVTINLTAPDPEFKYKLSVPHASILPAGTPPKDVGTKPIPGTGPYYFKSYNPNRSLVMARNPYFKEWSVKAQPDGYPDQITQTFGLTVEAQVTAIQNGQADWTLEQPPADRLSEIGTKYASQVHVTPLTAFWYIPMNTNMAPFNKLKARQAFNFAVDRNAAVKIFGGKNLASPSCQVLPPGFPGHKDYCPYTKNPGTKWSAPDVAKAKQLVKESGTLGQKVTVVVPDDEVNKAMGVYTAERSEPDRLQGERQGDLGEHLLHLRAEHEEQGADQRAAVVPGLPGCIGLPQHPVRLRLVPSGQRLEHQHRRLLRQEDRRADEARACARVGGRERGQRRVGEDRPRGDGCRPDGDPVQPEAHRLRLEAGRQLHLQQAVLLARLAVVGQVGTLAGAGRVPGPRSLGGR